jgi:hypothetical protein
MMIGLSQAPVAACSSIFLPSGYTGSVTCDPSLGPVNYVSNPITPGETETAPMLPCSEYTVPPGFTGNIPCDSSAGDVNVAAPEVEATATVVSATANTADTSSDASLFSPSLGMIVVIGIAAWAIFGGAT